MWNIEISRRNDKAGEMYSDHKRKIPLDIIWRMYDWLKPIFDLVKDVGFFRMRKKYLTSMKIEPNLPDKEENS
jgi:hypothetical protein